LPHRQLGKQAAKYRLAQASKCARAKPVPTSCRQARAPLRGKSVLVASAGSVYAVAQDDRQIFPGMYGMIDVFISPARTWSPPSSWHPSNITIPRPVQKKAASHQPGWEELAFDQNWSAALLGHLQQHRRGGTKLWSVINAVVSESCPEDRGEVRESTKAVLRALMTLIREKRVLRFKREWVASLDLPCQIVPLCRQDMRPL
jgi:hypothetical protein